MKGGRAMLVDVSSVVEIINGLWSRGLQQEQCGGGWRRASVIEASESGLKRKGGWVKY